MIPEVYMLLCCSRKTRHDNLCSAPQHSRQAVPVGRHLPRSSRFRRPRGWRIARRPILPRGEWPADGRIWHQRIRSVGLPRQSRGGLGHERADRLSSRRDSRSEQRDCAAQATRGRGRHVVLLARHESRRLPARVGQVHDAQLRSGPAHGAHRRGLRADVSERVPAPQGPEGPLHIGLPAQRKPGKGGVPAARRGAHRGGARERRELRQPAQHARAQLCRPRPVQYVQLLVRKAARRYEGF